MSYTPSPLPLCLRILIDILLYASACGGLAVLFLLSNPVKRGFHCDDLSIRYPKLPDTITGFHLLLVGVVAPVVTIIGVEIICRLLVGRSRSLKDVILTTGKLVGMYIYGLVICVLVTELLKTCVGRLRPHFLETCGLEIPQENCTNGFLKPEEYECSGEVPYSSIKDARKSFPSGHASIAFYAASYLIIYIEQRLDVGFSLLLKSLIQVGLILVACFCAASRVSDNRHHAEDVLAGAAIGVIVSIWLIFWVARHVRRESPLSSANKATAWQGGECVVLTDALEPHPEHRSPPRSPTNPDNPYTTKGLGQHLENPYIARNKGSKSKDHSFNSTRSQSHKMDPLLRPQTP